MTDFTVIISNPDHLDGITWAREQYDAEMTDDEYIQWLIEQAAASYATQKAQAQWRVAYEASLNAPTPQSQKVPSVKPDVVEKPDVETE